jgi:hypothetical protein
MFVGSTKEGIRGYRQRFIAFRESLQELGLDFQIEAHMYLDEESKEAFAQEFEQKLSTYKPTAYPYFWYPNRRRYR